MDAGVGEPCLACGPVNESLDHLLRQRLTIVPADDPSTTKVPMDFQGPGEPAGQRDPPRPATLRLGHVPSPFRPPDNDVGRTPLQIEIIPLQCHDLPAPQTRLTTQQHDEMGVPVDECRGLGGLRLRMAHK